MENHPERPVRNRAHVATLELCINKKAGPNGSLELIVSNPRYEAPAFYYWPMNVFGHLHGDQITDLCNVLNNEVSETVWTRINVQDEIPGLL